MAIVMALQSAPIYRLQKTWAVRKKINLIRQQNKERFSFRVLVNVIVQHLQL
jgi:hypothetical protein